MICVISLFLTLFLSLNFIELTRLILLKLVFIVNEGLYQPKRVCSPGSDLGNEKLNRSFQVKTCPLTKLVYVLSRTKALNASIICEVKIQRTIHPFSKSLVSSNFLPVRYFLSIKVKNNPFHFLIILSSFKLSQWLRLVLQ